MNATFRLMPRDDFAALKLAEKNDYLQSLADGYAEANKREPVVLNVDAISRLRRYYLRRIWADLKLKDAPDNEMNQALQRLGEAVRLNALTKDVEAALRQETIPKRVLRAPPADDAQMMFFVPAIYDAPIKDDVNLMDVAPFSLAKNARTGVIKYELKDSLITIEGGAESGLATVFDYDIFLNMVSYLAEEVRQFKQQEGKGLRPTLPARAYRPNASHILKFCRRSDGGKSYEDLEAALDRLTKTTIKVTNLGGGKRRQVDSRPLLGGYTVVSRTATNKVDLVELTIPDWVYNAVVQNEKNLPLLTMHGDYFLISSGIGRFIYRLARKATGAKGEAAYGIKELHKRSGSPQELRKFLYDLRQFVKRTEAFPMPEYDLSFYEGKEGPVLKMTKRMEPGQIADASLTADS